MIRALDYESSRPSSNRSRGHCVLFLEYDTWLSQSIHYDV